MTLIELNPISRENLGWSLAGILAMKNYPRLARALGRTALYIGLTPLRETKAISQIFVQELLRKPSQVKPAAPAAASAVSRTASKIKPVLAAGARLAKRNPYVIGGSLAVGITTAGMVKQNPPPTIAFQRVPV